MIRGATVVLGDVEGDWEKVDSFFKRSGAFQTDPQGRVSLKQGYGFIFMGDAIDKGEASLRILETFLALKEEHPDDVVLILGNRDINKLRLPLELSSEALAGAPNDEVATQTFEAWRAEKGLSSELHSHGPTRLKWIFEKTMGAPKAFEFRRQELARRAGEVIDDQVVFESVLSDLDPGSGILSRYLRVAQLAFFEPGHKALFVHGGLTPEAFGSIPGRGAKVENLSMWVAELNAWAQREIAHGISEKDGATDLVKYQQPISGTRENQASVIYGRNFDATANPEMIPESLQDELLRNGVETLVIGHTPVGEMPVLISSKRFRMVFVDNSLSSGKGSSVTHLSGRTLHVAAPDVAVKSPLRTIHTPVVYEHVVGEESEIGRKVEDGWVVGSTGQESVVFRINKDAGFKVEYSTGSLLNPTCRKST